MAISLTQIATDLISQLGYTGLGLGLFVDSFGVPIPSEILVPLAAVLAKEGRFTYWAVFVVATVAQVLGGLAGYLIGRYGGEPILERYGKYVLITHRDLERTHQAFEKYGNWFTMAGRCVPGIRGLIAYPAGVAKMSLATFLIFTTIGSAFWTLFLMYLGAILGRHLAAIDQFAGVFSIIGIAVVIGLLAWHFRHLWWRRDSR